MIFQFLSLLQFIQPQNHSLSVFVFVNKNLIGKISVCLKLCLGFLLFQILYIYGWPEHLFQQGLSGTDQKSMTDFTSLLPQILRRLIFVLGNSRDTTLIVITIPSQLLWP